MLSVDFSLPLADGLTLCTLFLVTMLDFSDVSDVLFGALEAEMVDSACSLLSECLLFEPALTKVFSAASEDLDTPRAGGGGGGRGEEEEVEEGGGAGGGGRGGRGGRRRRK